MLSLLQKASPRQHYPLNERFSARKCSNTSNYILPLFSIMGTDITDVKLLSRFQDTLNINTGVWNAVLVQAPKENTLKHYDLRQRPLRKEIRGLTPSPRAHPERRCWHISYLTHNFTGEQICPILQRTEEQTKT